ncbi:hypothetical protein GGD70_000884 [Paraburkholderia fungorum]|nr:hypothetical protein [Paraburkholderia fungorum]
MRQRRGFKVIDCRGSGKNGAASPRRTVDLPDWQHADHAYLQAPARSGWEHAGGHADLNRERMAVLENRSSVRTPRSELRDRNVRESESARSRATRAGSCAFRRKTCVRSPEGPHIWSTRPTASLVVCQVGLPMPLPRSTSKRSQSCACTFSNRLGTSVGKSNMDPLTTLCTCKVTQKLV